MKTDFFGHVTLFKLPPCTIMVKDRTLAAILAKALAESPEVLDGVEHPEFSVLTDCSDGMNKDRKYSITNTPYNFRAETFLARIRPGDSDELRNFRHERRERLELARQLGEALKRIEQLKEERDRLAEPPAPDLTHVPIHLGEVGHG